jgi:hypothetical protein
MTTWREVNLPGGLTAEVPDDAVTLDIVDGVLTLHRNLADQNTTEYWKTKDAFVALRDAIADEYQEIENAFWDIVASRDLDRAATDALAKRARLVGIDPGPADDATRVRIRAAELINRSDGTVNAVLRMLNLFGQTWHIRECPPAAFVVQTAEPVNSAATERELGGLVAKARAAGVRADVIMPAVGTTPFRWGDPWSTEQWCDRRRA